MKQKYEIIVPGFEETVKIFIQADNESSALIEALLLLPFGLDSDIIDRTEVKLITSFFEKELKGAACVN